MGRSAPLVRSYDGSIILGYAAFAVIALVAIYFASGGPGFSASDLSAMAMMPSCDCRRGPPAVRFCWRDVRAEIAGA
jgi:hypothetical protein